MSSAPVTDPIFEPWTYTGPDPRSAFGPIVSAFDVEHALAACVRRWMRDYLAEVCRQHALAAEQLPVYRAIVVSGDISDMPEDQTPGLLVASPGVPAGHTRRIRKHGDGSYDATFQLECVSLVSARGNRQAGKLVRLYAAALRLMCLQQALEPPPPLTFSRVEWTGEGTPTAALPSSADRTLAARTVTIDVDVAELGYWQRGPLEPLFPPTDPDKPPEPIEQPEITSTHIAVDKKQEA